MKGVKILLSAVAAAICISASAQDSLKQQTKMLDEVVVESQSIVRMKDYVLIRPTKNERSHATNAMEMLGNVMLPGVDVGSSGITVFHQNAGIFLDGAPVKAEDINKIRPQDIAKVEFIDNPTGQYAQYTYAFNFVLKKQETGGYVLGKGEETLGFQNRNYELAVSMNHKNSTFSVFGGTKYNNHGQDTEDFEEIYRLADGTINRSGHSESRSREATHYGMFNFRNSTAKHFIQTKASLYYNGGPRTNTIGEAYDNGLLSDFISWSTSRSLVPAIDLSSNFNLPGNQNLSLSGHGEYSRNHYNHFYSEGDFKSISDQKEDTYSFYLNATYAKNFKFGNLSFSASHFRYYWNIDESGSYPLSQKLRQNETIALAGFNGRLGKGWTGNVRIGISLLHHNVNKDNPYTNLSPRASLNFQRVQGKHTYSISSVWNTGSYLSSSMSEAEIAVNPWLAYRGNPNLKKQHQIAVFMNYSYTSERFSIYGGPTYYHYIRNANYQYIQSGDYLIRTLTGCNYDLIGFATSATWSKGKTLKTNLYASYEHGRSHGFLNRNCNKVFLNGSINWYLGNFRFSPSISWGNRELSIYSGSTERSTMRYSLTASYGWNNLYVGLRASTPFNKVRKYSDYTSEFFDSHKVSCNRMNSRYLTLTVQYSFDFGRKMQHEYNYVGGNTNSSITRL